MKNPNCYHQCSGNCRRIGCNCKCGEFHQDFSSDRVFSHEQLAQIERMKAEQDEIQEDTTSMEEKLEALDNLTP